ncbi:MAG TPA: hypothetical protein PLI18_02825 [Pirellulaceae bacterium]|nr:hypothetical protein [Pirellulaceae bacterium]
MRQRRSFRRSLLLWSVVAGAILPSFGCIGMGSQLLYVLVGHKQKAEYDDLKDQRVAIAVLSDGRGVGPDYSMQVLAQLIEARLGMEYKKKIELIPQLEVSGAIDERSRDPDFIAIGQSLRADKVITVEVADYHLRAGGTLYRGSCMYSVRVFDIKEGKQVFKRGPIPFSYPTEGSPAIDTTETQFEQMYLSELSYRIARYFYDYEVRDDYGRDAIAYR